VSQWRPQSKSGGKRRSEEWERERIGTVQKRKILAGGVGGRGKEEDGPKNIGGVERQNRVFYRQDRGTKARQPVCP